MMGAEDISDGKTMSGIARDPVPQGASRILASLIVVAAVANLNLSVANVALPSIGLAFTASQTSLDLVAVGYSLGLAASVLWLGAVGDHYGRKMLLLLGIGLSIPACLVAAFAPTIEVLIGRPHRRWRIRRHGLPDHSGTDHRPLGAGTRANPFHRALVGPWRRHRGPRATGVGVPAREVRMGFCLPGYAAARCCRAVHGVEVRACPRQRDRRSGRQPRRHPFGGARRGTHPVDQLRTRAEHGNAGRRPCHRRHRGGGRFRRPSTPGREPVVRPRHRGPADVLGRRSAPGSSCSVR